MSVEQLGEGAEDVRAAIRGILEEAVGWSGPLPEGELASHLDSVQQLALVVEIEDRFRIALERADEEDVRTMEDLVRLIIRKRGNGEDPF